MFLRLKRNTGRQNQVLRKEWKHVETWNTIQVEVIEDKNENVSSKLQERWSGSINIIFQLISFDFKYFLQSIVCHFIFLMMSLIIKAFNFGEINLTCFSFFPLFQHFVSNFPSPIKGMDTVSCTSVACSVLFLLLHGPGQCSTGPIIAALYKVL